MQTKVTPRKATTTEVILSTEEKEALSTASAILEKLFEGSIRVSLKCQGKLAGPTNFDVEENYEEAIVAQLIMDELAECDGWVSYDD